MDPIFVQLMRRAGVEFMGQNPQMQRSEFAHDAQMAADAQPGLITNSNSGIPAFLSTYIDPKLIEILVQPMRIAEVVGQEVKKGNWVTETAMFPVIESTGVVNSYGDYHNGGVAGANSQFPQRQSYHYQVVTQWGEKELARAGLARIDWANRLNIASVLTLNKYQNKTYAFGVAGLQNYGLLNDPALPAAVSPTTGVGGNTWALKTATEILNDIAKLFTTLQTQSGGLVELDSKLTLGMSPIAETYLTKTSDFNVNVFDRIKKNYPNLTIKTAPEYTTGSGELVQMIADEIEGQRTVESAFTEKLRAHPIIVKESSFSQKKSQGTWGTVIYRPFLISQMLGV